jgi:hypothetical protein
VLVGTLVAICLELVLQDIGREPLRMLEGCAHSPDANVAPNQAATVIIRGFWRTQLHGAIIERSWLYNGLLVAGRGDEYMRTSELRRRGSGRMQQVSHTTISQRVTSIFSQEFLFDLIVGL